MAMDYTVTAKALRRLLKIVPASGSGFADLVHV